VADDVNKVRITEQPEDTECLSANHAGESREQKTELPPHLRSGARYIDPRGIHILITVKTRDIACCMTRTQSESLPGRKNGRAEQTPPSRMNRD
jgi:hypothetical protein